MSDLFYIKSVFYINIFHITKLGAAFEKSILRIHRRSEKIEFRSPVCRFLAHYGCDSRLLSSREQVSSCNIRKNSILPQTQIYGAGTVSLVNLSKSIAPALFVVGFADHVCSLRNCGRGWIARSRHQKILFLCLADIAGGHP